MALGITQSHYLYISIANVPKTLIIVDICVTLNLKL